MKYSLTANVQNTLQDIYNDYDINISKSSQLAKNILSLSTNYQKELSDHSDIWKQKSLLSAYLGYTLPLNILRLTSALNEMKKYFKDSPLTIYDYGCGPGTGQLAFNNANIEFDQFFACDKSYRAVEIYKEWNKNNQVSVSNEPQQNVKKESLALLSYSLNEMGKLPEHIYSHDHILIIEPSTQISARHLQGLRKTFIEQKYNLLAPCTHHQDCPLLKHSKKDWCHHRIHVELPDWLIKLDKYLPIKNKTLTYSYLLLSKNKEQINKGCGRIIGDLLKEKGKTRQAFCRNNDREFITILKRNKISNSIERGDIVKLNRDIAIKGNEIRIESEDDTSII